MAIAHSDKVQGQRQTFYIAHQRKQDGAQQSLEEHLFGVASEAKSFAAKIHLEEQGELIGLLHDLGKYSEEFQNYLQSAVGLLNPDEDEEFVDAKELKGKIDHSTAGAQLVWQELSTRGQLGQIVGQILALCIGSHHSGLIDCLSSNAKGLGEDVFTRRMQKLAERTHLHEAVAKMDKRIADRFRELVNKPVLLDGLKNSISKIMRNDLELIKATSDRNAVTQFKIGLLVRLLFSCLIDADRINTADFENPEAAEQRPKGKYLEWDLLIERLEKELQGKSSKHPIDEIRRRVSEECRKSASRNKGIYTLTVPTGGGKTLASLRFALHHAKLHGMDRVIYAIPFTSIIDQNAEVVREILEPSGVAPGSVVLEHHSNLTPEEQTWKSKILSENWDAPVIYTTNVQLLETLFGAGTRGARRMHQLANAVLVFDEIQTLPLNCIHLFCNAINFLVEHCGSTVVLCTATQPLLNRVEPAKGALRVTDASEIMPDVTTLFADLKRVEVLNRRKPGGWSNEESARLALEEVDRCKSCLVIVNTKRSAREIFQLCHNEATFPLYHLSTSMCAAHRRKVLRDIREHLDRKEHLLCISTQLIEAGVDIDFGSVIRFMAGLDSIAQAAGRCNRNGSSELGRVHVVNPSDESIERLTDIRCGKDTTARLLDEYEKHAAMFGTDLVGPQAMEWYFHYYFFDRRNDMDYPVSATTLGHDDTLLNLLSVNPQATEEFRRCHSKLPNLYLRQSFMSAAKAFKAIDAPTRGVIVPYGEEGKAIINELCSAFMVEKQWKLIRKAQQYTVNVFPHELLRLRDDGAVFPVQEDTDILYLDARYYSSKFGLSLTPVGEMEVLNA
ncbi:MAG: CRISPR-associated helicase Cas3' [Candidatus Binatia bacterium]